MMKRMVISLAVVVVLMAGAATASVLTARYELGESDPGAAVGVLGADPTVDSLGGLDLTRYGDPTYSGKAAPIGSTLSMSFDGDDFYQAGLPTPGPTDNVSLSAWVYPTAVDGFNFVASLGDPSNKGLGIIQQGGTWRIIHQGIQLSDPGPAVVLDTWTKLELRRFGGISELYVNDTATGVTLTTTPHAPTLITIGANAHPNGPEGFFKGQIDEVVVIPEPATIGLLGLGGLVALRQKRRI